MWRCEDVKMSRCEDEKMWRWADVKMRRCADVKMRRCEDVRMWRCEDVRMRRCEDMRMWGWEDVKMWGCEDEDVKMWGVRRCEDEKMWRWADVKMRRCEDVRMWRCENVCQIPTIRRTLRSDALGNKGNHSFICNICNRLFGKEKGKASFGMIWCTRCGRQWPWKDRGSNMSSPPDWVLNLSQYQRSDSSSNSNSITERSNPVTTRRLGGKQSISSNLQSSELRKTRQALHPAALAFIFELNVCVLWEWSRGMRLCSFKPQLLLRPGAKWRLEARKGERAESPARGGETWWQGC